MSRPLEKKIRDRLSAMVTSSWMISREAERVLSSMDDEQLKDLYQDKGLITLLAAKLEFLSEKFIEMFEEGYGLSIETDQGFGPVTIYPEGPTYAPLIKNANLDFLLDGTEFSNRDSFSSFCRKVLEEEIWAQLFLKKLRRESGKRIKAEESSHAGYL